MRPPLPCEDLAAYTSHSSPAHSLLALCFLALVQSTVHPVPPTMLRAHQAARTQVLLSQLPLASRVEAVLWCPFWGPLHILSCPTPSLI